MSQSSQINWIGFAMILTGIAANATTIPIAKGNTWSYSYVRDTGTNWFSGSVRYSGSIRFRIDSAKSNGDTIIFSVSYYDSGQKYDTNGTSKSYGSNYSVEYKLAFSTIIKRSGQYSPGYDENLLSYVKLNDTFSSYAGVDGAMGFNDSSNFSRKTESNPLTINGSEMVLVTTKVYDQWSIYRAGNVGRTSHASWDTLWWVETIGMAHFAEKDSDLFRLNMVRTTYSTYTLTSYNNRSIPPFFPDAVKPATIRYAPSHSTRSNSKFILLGGNNLKCRWLIEDNPFNLRGQRLRPSVQNQLIICRRR